MVILGSPTRCPSVKTVRKFKKKNGTIIELHPRKRNNRDEGLSEKYLFLMLFKGSLKVSLFLPFMYSLYIYSKDLSKIDHFSQ